MSSRIEFDKTIQRINNVIEVVRRNSEAHSCDMSIASNVQSANDVIRKFALNGKISSAYADILSERLFTHAQNFISNCACLRRG